MKSKRKDYLLKSKKRLDLSNQAKVQVLRQAQVFNLLRIVQFSLLYLLKNKFKKCKQSSAALILQMNKSWQIRTRLIWLN